MALGGYPTREGNVSKNTLIEIIKTEFELTIDMEVSYTINLLAFYLLLIKDKLIDSN